MELNLQLNTKATYNRDMMVELTNQATGQKVNVKPYLDGKVVARNIEPGQWRAVVKHPNMLFPVYDKPVRVFPDRPTFVPVRIPENIFENTPIEDTPEADLAPVQARFDDAAAQAGAQANKLAGQPIYADDWNLLAGTIGDLARASGDLSKLVSPIGHDHPEIATKIDEVQANLQRFYDLFGRSLAQLQRQVQQLALQRQIEAAVGTVPNVSPKQREELDKAVGDLAGAWADKPATYSLKKKRAGQALAQTINAMVADSDTPVENEPAVKKAQEVVAAMASEQPAADYSKEIENQQRIETRSGGAPLTDALIGFNLKGGG